MSMAKCYVGTYGKYNEGNLAGKWLDLNDYPTYKDFCAACRELHKNECDPEFMIQDWEGLPDGFAATEWISEKDFNDIKEALQDEEKADLQIVDYSEKAFAVVGDTKTIKDDLKKLGGRFNPKLTCGAGWIFSKKSLDEVQKYLNSGEVAANNAAPKQEKDEALWAEYKKRLAKAEAGDYYLKDTSALMMTDCGVIMTFDKKKINAGTFWFHDEEPDYEYYQQVAATDKTKTEYFLRENLREYDDLIKRMTDRADEYGQPLVPVFYEQEWCGRGLLGWGGKPCMKREYDVRSDENDFRTRNCIHRMTESDCAKALAILKDERAKFEKRLHAYLKRYGVSKIHFGTYWADR